MAEAWGLFACNARAEEANSAVCAVIDDRNMPADERRQRMVAIIWKAIAVQGELLEQADRTGNAEAARWARHNIEGFERYLKIL